jgi:hypothetical protein
MTSDLDYKSKQQALMLKKYQDNSRVSVIRVSAPSECTVGQMIQGVYAKDETPELPHKACARPGGCICSYDPVLDDIYP